MVGRRYGGGKIATEKDNEYTYVNSYFMCSKGIIKRFTYEVFIVKREPRESASSKYIFIVDFQCNRSYFVMDNKSSECNMVTQRNFSNCFLTM